MSTRDAVLNALPGTSLEISKRLGTLQKTVLFHLTNLLDEGMVEVAGQQKIKGGQGKQPRIFRRRVVTAPLDWWNPLHRALYGLTDSSRRA